MSSDRFRITYFTPYEQNTTEATPPPPPEKMYQKVYTLTATQLRSRELATELHRREYRKHLMALKEWPLCKCHGVPKEIVVEEHSHVNAFYLDCKETK